MYKEDDVIRCFCPAGFRTEAAASGRHLLGVAVWPRFSSASLLSEHFNVIPLKQIQSVADEVTGRQGE